MQSCTVRRASEPSSQALRAGVRVGWGLTIAAPRAAQLALDVLDCTCPRCAVDCM